MTTVLDRGSFLQLVAGVAILALAGCGSGAGSSGKGGAGGGGASGGSPGKTGGSGGPTGGTTGGTGTGGAGPGTGGTAPGTGGGAGGSGGTGNTGTGGAAGARGTGGQPGSGGAAGSNGAGSGGVTGTGGAACVPSCTNKTCGSDGCNGTCGGCPPAQMCTASGVCQTKSGAGIAVDASVQLTPISPDIYGVAFATDAGDDSYKVATLDRWGGDAAESYNWQKDINNSGSDWNCANYAGSGSGTDTFVQTNKSNGLTSLMTIPITGWLANVATTPDDTYSAQLGQNLSYCNYPQLPDGGLLDSATCCQAIGTQESVLVDKGSKNLDTTFMGNWVSHFVSTFGSAAAGGVKYYQLDNEPDNWQGLRKDIFPALYPPGTWCMDYTKSIASGNEAGVTPNDDLINRSVAYAAAVKTADPTAQVLFLSVMNPDDAVNLLYTECGVGQSWGTQFPVPYTADNSYAMAMMAKGKQYEAAHHQRIFDCLDTHYPGGAADLWKNNFSRFQGWINASYPGTGICVSEYNISNDHADTTAAAQEADLLGTFGVMGVRLAAYWTTLVYKDASNALVHNYSYNAFAMFRDYDGAGAKFGDVSVGAASGYGAVHAYAATDSATNPTTLWIMLVNTGTSAQSNATVSIGHFAAGSSAKVYKSVNGGAPAAASNVPVANGAVSGLTLDANSITLLVVGH
jgi:hypothetical protein